MDDRFNNIKQLSNERAIRIAELDRIVDQQKETIKKLKEEIDEIKSRSSGNLVAFITCEKCKTPNTCRVLKSCSESLFTSSDELFI